MAGDLVKRELAELIVVKSKSKILHLLVELKRTKSYWIILLNGHDDSSNGGLSTLITPADAALIMSHLTLMEIDSGLFE